MNAFLLTILLFLFWSFVGRAILSVLSGHRSVRDALLSPIVGVTSTTILTAWVNGAGIPVRQCGPVIGVVLFVAAVIILARTRPIVPVQRLKGIAVSLLIAVLITGYPMLRFGFGWLAFGNDDMANYCLASRLFLDHGFFDIPNGHGLFYDQYASSFYYFWNVLGGIRSGSEETLAWVSSCTGLTSLEAFMPVTLALQLALISATGALVFRNSKQKAPAIVICTWLAVSALIALGTVYELIAQVYGLALLGGICAVAMSSFGFLPRAAILRMSILCAILGAGIGIVYPEILPFAALPIVAYHLRLALLNRETLRSLVAAVASTAVSLLFVLGPFTPSAIQTLAQQASRGTQSSSVTVLFPYYLLPSGLAQIWGFLPLSQWNSPFLGLAIVAGGFLLALTVVGAFWIAWRGERSGMILLVMTVVGIELFAKRIGFGLFKIAMFAQPFLIGSAVLSWFRLVEVGSLFRKFSPRQKSVAVLTPLGCIIAFGLYGQAYYVQRSAGGVGAGFVEITHGSETQLNLQLRRIRDQAHGQNIISDSNNAVLAKLEALYVSPAALFFPSVDYFRPLVGWRPSSVFSKFLHIAAPRYHEAIEASDRRLRDFRTVALDMKGAYSSPNEFEVRPLVNEIARGEFTLLESWRSAGILNRHGSANPNIEPSIRLVPSKLVRNYLVYVVSSLGKSNTYGSPEARSAGVVSLYSPEADYFRAGGIMSALGRDVLFGVLKPDPTVRIVFDYTASLNSDGDNRIPPASVIGSDRIFFQAQGRGSARLFSPPVRPQTIAEGNYLCLDVGSGGKMFPERRKGIMRMYGSDVRTDPRRITGFARDISAISEEEYLRMDPPARLKTFPGDLSNPNLEYSGIYEDGWVAESSFLVLGEPAKIGTLVVRVMIPEVNGSPAASTLAIRIDGREAGGRRLNGGDNELRIPLVSSAIRKHRIELVFDRVVRLPEPDSRPVSALVRFVGFE